MRSTLRRRRLAQPEVATVTPVVETTTTTAAETVAQAKIDARDRIIAVTKEFMAEHRAVFTQFMELTARAEAAEVEAKEAILAIETSETWNYSEVTRGAKPSTPVFDIALLPSEVLLTPGIIRSIDNVKLEQMATGTLAHYAQELANAKKPNSKNPSVSFANKTPASKSLKKLLD